MLIKKATYKTVTVKRQEEVTPDVYGCDECGKEITDYPNESQRLVADVFRHDQETEHLHFCSWDCLISKIPKIECEYFISLPFLYYDEDKNSKRGAEALIRIIKSMKKS